MGLKRKISGDVCIKIYIRKLCGGNHIKIKLYEWCAVDDGASNANLKGHLKIMKFVHLFMFLIRFRYYWLNIKVFLLVDFINFQMLATNRSQEL